MRVLIQRVIASSVSIEGKTVGSIGKGLNLLVGIAPADTDTELAWMAKKCLNLRLFPQGTDSSFDASVLEIEGELLVISQFTLYGDSKKGRRPSFSKAAPPQQAEQLYDQFVNMLKASGLKVETGQFGKNMQVSIENDGPVTLWLERESKH